MAFTQEQLTELEAAIASGAKEVKMANGNTAIYHSLEQMLAVKSMMEQDLGITDTKSGMVTMNANTGL